MGKASSLHLKTLLPKTSPEETTLVPPQPAVDTTRILPQLPRKPIGTVVKHSDGDSAKVGPLYLPAEHQQTLPKIPTPRPPPMPQSRNADNMPQGKTAENGAPNELDETTPRMLASSKKKSEGTLSTVTTGIGGSAA